MPFEEHEIERMKWLFRKLEDNNISEVTRRHLATESGSTIRRLLEEHGYIEEQPVQVVITTGADIETAAKAHYEQMAGMRPGYPVWETLGPGKMERSWRESALIKATTGLDEHPEDYTGPCNCKLCQSYT